MTPNKLTLAPSLCLWLLVASTFAKAEAPEPFRGHDPNSTYTINYDDLNSLLSATVLVTGRSSRETAAPSNAKTGTRVKNKVNGKTANEGNRFYYETFKDTPEYGALLKNIKESLEKVPDEVPLKYFSRNEQLAYWLNLYNATLLNELVNNYPQRSLKKMVTGKKSILSKKLLTVAGIPLSLDDLRDKILKENYDNSPLIIYGLYQGIIGGPNIRKRAYSGENVYRNLQANAREFINSNRGTFAQDENIFRVSSLYDRNADFFDDFDKDLRAHLMEFLEGRERSQLQSASTIRTNIHDWTITDLYGSQRQKGGSVSDNRAALIGAVQNTSITDSGGTITTTMSADSAAVYAQAKTLDRFPPELLTRLRELDMRREAAAEQGSSVVIEDFVKDEEESGDTEQEAAEEQE